MTEKRYKLANPNNLFKDMNIGIVENNTRMLKLTDVVDLLNSLSEENKQLKHYNQRITKVLEGFSPLIPYFSLPQ